MQPLQAEIASLKSELTKVKSDLGKVKAKANDNEQYSRRNNIRIFRLQEEDGEDCYETVLTFYKDVLTWGEKNLTERIVWENQK